MPFPPLKAMFYTIQMMKFYLCTSFGDSDLSYGGTKDHPFHGVCQGNGGGPAVWLAVSAILVEMLHSLFHYTVLSTPASREKRRSVGQLYVDDTDLCQMLSPHDPSSGVVQKLSDIVQ